MDAKRWAEIRDLFERALELEEPERQSFLERACADDPGALTEVRSLIEASETVDSFVDGEDLVPTGREVFAEEHPESIGPYLIERVLGEGGMGTVYLAEQREPIQRKVAVKLIKIGMNTPEVIRRFEAERNVLARMDHPGIAKVIDAGATSTGRLFFAMEYVEGVPIVKYCDEERLPVEERLKLFEKACLAIQHAHQKGVIHRDIKPSNLLVGVWDGEPSPKVIDFGIAKATDVHEDDPSLTRQGQLLGTPEYMSPEQLEMSGSVDTSTDVYALGVVLFELLTGTLPWKARTSGDLSSLRAHVLTQAPERPSTRIGNLGNEAAEIARNRSADPRALRKLLSGELDWIVLRALEREPAERYSSVSELANEIRRYLRNEPVLARAPTTAYQARKLIARNKALFTFTVFLGGVLLAFGITSSMLYSRSQFNLERALEAERTARHEAESAEQISTFLVDIFEVSNPGEAEANSITAREVLDVGAARIEDELGEQPLVQSDLMHTIGTVYGNMGLLSEAQSLLEDALAIRETELGRNDPRVAETLLALGDLKGEAAEFSQARVDLERALEILRDALGPEDPKVASALNVLAALSQEEGHYGEAERIYLESLRIREMTLGPLHEDVGQSRNNLGTVYFRQGRYEEAAKALRAALEIRRATLGPDHPKVGTTMNSIGICLQRAGDLETAREMYEGSLEIRERSLGSDHILVADPIQSLAILHRTQRRFDEAEQLQRRALSIREAALGPNHPDTAEALIQLAAILDESGRASPLEVEQLFLDGISRGETNLDPDHPQLARFLARLADFYIEAGRDEDAEPLLLRVVEANRARLDVDHPSRMRSLETLADLMRRTGREAEAVRLQAEANRFDLETGVAGEGR